MKTTPAASSSGTSVSLLDCMLLNQDDAVHHMFTVPHAVGWGAYTCIISYSSPPPQNNYNVDTITAFKEEEIESWLG